MPHFSRMGHSLRLYTVAEAKLAACACSCSACVTHRSKISRPIPIVSGIKKITIIGLSITAETVKPQAVQVRELVIIASG